MERDPRRAEPMTLGHLPRWIWPVTARLTMTVGLGCAVVVWGLWGPVATALSITFAVAAIAASAGMPLGAAVHLGRRLSVVVVASGGLVAATGWAGVLLLGLQASLSPLVAALLATGGLVPALQQVCGGGTAPAVRELETTAGAPPVDSWRSSVVVLDGMPTTEGVASLDDKALCEAWRRSYVRLGACTSVELRHEVVRRRQLYLDELVRRHPAETRRWLEAGARAAGNPLPFLGSADPSAGTETSDGPA